MYNILKSPLSNFFLRPWFDSVAVRIVADWYAPLSRIWAVALSCNGDYRVFSKEFDTGICNIINLKKSLKTVNELNSEYAEAACKWDEIFFGDRELAVEILSQTEMFRLSTANKLSRSRIFFLPLRKTSPKIKWSIQTPEEVENQFGKLLGDSSKAFLPFLAPKISESKRAEGLHGPISWIKMKSPVINDIATAKVFRPKEKIKGTILWLHGVGLEPEMWSSLVDPINQLVTRGFCVVQPEGPWHGRRRKEGYFGGEPVFARGVSGFVEFFRAWVIEAAHWCVWVREAIGGKIAVGGISIGALTSQLLISSSGNWPEKMRADACFLVTTTNNIIDASLKGSLSQRLGLETALYNAGWNREQLLQWKRLIEPSNTPVIPPEKIVMLLGTEDTVTPYAGGISLADMWNVPLKNRFVQHRGHFSVPLALYKDTSPLLRLTEILK
ncbi:MAG: hypothetical protein CMM44_11430 [Rhodospirillaceae bacterium]|nr:hypothetical protein [Rhodospirillaceae bacterium]